MSRRPAGAWPQRMADLLRFVGGPQVIGRIPSATPVARPGPMRMIDEETDIPTGTPG